MLRPTCLLVLATTNLTAWASPIDDALVVGDCHSALAEELPSPTPPAVRLALARCAIAQSHSERALALLEPLTDDPWGGHAEALRGAALLLHGRPIDAVQALQHALDDERILHPLRAQIRLRLGQALIGIEDPEGARNVLRPMLDGSLARPGALPVPGGVDPGEVRWWLAQTAVKRDLPDKALPLWRTIWVRNPTSPFAARAEQALADAGTPVPDMTSPEGRTLMEGRIRTLQKLFRYPKALALREQLPDSHAMRAPHAFAGAVFRAKDYARATNLLVALPNRSRDEGVLLALAKVRSGDPMGSTLVYVDLARGDDSVAELARYKLGYMAYDQGHLDEAITALAQYLNRHPMGKHADSALWFSAMSHIRLGNGDAALDVLRTLLKQHPRSGLRVGAAYWLGRVQGQLGDVGAEQTQLRTLIERHPQTGYAWFAANRLGQTWTSIPAVAPPEPPAGFANESWALGTALTEAGILSWARPHLRSLLDSARSGGRDSALALAQALIEAGSYTDAQRLAEPYCGTPGDDSDPVAAQLCWPRPSGDRVRALTVSAGLPEHLPFAIMTAESALKPEVTSPAGARGLMQLMPTLGETLHTATWPDRPYDADALFQPAYNATLGTTELTRLAERFGDVDVTPTLPLVIAGYNGGADAVTRWVETPGAPSDGDLWSECIGYTETRKYVRRVLGYLQTYRMVYGDPPAASTEPG